MGRFPQLPSQKGSQKWIQKSVNERPELLDSKIRVELDMPENENICWLSPLEEDEFAEYRDTQFVKLLGAKTEKPLEDFWPSRGPQWDALARSNTGRLFLVEAKSHIPELISSLRAENEDSIRLIHESLEETKIYLTSSTEADWSRRFYQYTNRLAHLYFLRVLNKLPAYLVFVYFVNDVEQNGPTSAPEWEGALKLLHSYFGLGRHKLQKYVCDLFIDVNTIGAFTPRVRNL